MNVRIDIGDQQKAAMLSGGFLVRQILLIKIFIVTILITPITICTRLKRLQDICSIARVKLERIFLLE